MIEGMKEGVVVMGGVGGMWKGGPRTLVHLSGDPTHHPTQLFSNPATIIRKRDASNATKKPPKRKRSSRT